jgi:photosystem II stability/assembly factor-like uncharacterized protein
MTISRSILVCLLLLLAVSFGGCHKEVLWENGPKVRSSAFQGADLAWLVTDREGALLFTSDTGKTWNKVQGNAVGGRFDAVSFIDPKHGWAVNGKGQVWQTEDGGQSWTAISKLTASGSDDWRFISAHQLEFLDERNGWIRETFSIWRTGDGGFNWRKVFPPSPSKSEIKGQSTGGYFGDSKNAWVSGTNGEVYDTHDGGETWRIQTVLANGDFDDIYFLDEQTGWLLGYIGGETHTQLYRTDDGGEAWHKYPIANMQIESTQFLNPNDGWAVGTEASPVADNRSIRGVLLWTTDGGRSWKRIDMTPEERAFDRVHFVDAQHGWLFGRENLYRSEDGGKVWRIVYRLKPN